MLRAVASLLAEMAGRQGWHNALGLDKLTAIKGLSTSLEADDHCCKQGKA